jgi:hypothetical protein
MPLGRDSLPLRANEFVRPEDVAALEAKVNATSKAPEKPDFTLNDTTPDVPGAVTKTAEGTYLSDDGTVFSYLTFTIPALPADAAKQFLLYKVDGDSQYMIAAGPFTNTTDLTGVTIRDLTPRVVYAFGLVAFSGLDLVSTITTATGSPYLTPGDTTAPATPTGLAATVGTGKTVSLDWDDNTEADFSEYQVERSSTSSGTGFSRIAETRSSRFVDVEVALGTQYWYRVTAVDRSENVSGYSSVVTATPVVVPEGSVDTTTPSAPSAPTYVSSDTYLSGDGTAFAWIKIDSPGLPTGAVGLNILFKNKLSTNGYIVAAQVGAGAGNIRIDDLTPGLEYSFAAQAFSFSGKLSAVSSVLNYVAPGDTTVPANPTGGSFLAGNVSSASVSRPSPKLMGSPASQAMAAILQWTPSTSKDVLYYIAYGTTVDSDAAADVLLVDEPHATFLGRTTSSGPIYFPSAYVAGISHLYVRMKAIDASGNMASGWLRVGDAYSYLQYPAGTLVSQDASSVAITGGTVNTTTLSNVTLSSVAVGTESTARTALALGSIATQAASNVSISGGNVQTLSRLSTANFFANDGVSSGLSGGATAVDVKDVNLRVFSGTTQKFRVDYSTGEVYVQGNRVLSTRQATPTTLADVIAVLQAHGLCS